MTATATTVHDNSLDRTRAPGKHSTTTNDAHRGWVEGAHAETRHNDVWGTHGRAGCEELMCGGGGSAGGVCSTTTLGQTAQWQRAASRPARAALAGHRDVAPGRGRASRGTSGWPR
jgi:hypothetical protein